MSHSDDCPPIEIYLTVKGGLDAIDYYKRAFGAEEAFKQMADDGKRVLHANLEMFGGQIMLSDDFPEHSNDVSAPDSAGGASATIHINFKEPEKVDAAMDKAAKEGGEITMPAMDAFWGARYGRLRDPFGHVWSFAAPLETQD